MGGGGAAESGKRRNPLYDLFPSDDDDEEEEEPRGKGKGKVRGRAAYGKECEEDEEDEEEDAASSVMRVGVSVTGEDMGGGRTARFLDERFSKLLTAEYSDEEIGELDPDDPRVNGHEALEVRATSPAANRTCCMCHPCSTHARRAVAIGWRG